MSNISGGISVYSNYLKENCVLPEDFLSGQSPHASQLPAIHDVIENPVSPGCFDILNLHPASSGNLMAFDHVEVAVHGLFSINENQELINDKNGSVVFSISLGQNHALSYLQANAAMFGIFDLKSGHRIDISKKGPGFLDTGYRAPGASKKVPLLPLTYAASLFEETNANTFKDGSLSVEMFEKNGQRFIEISSWETQNIHLKFVLDEKRKWGDGYRDENNHLRAYRKLSFPDLDAAQSYVQVDDTKFSLDENHVALEVSADATLRNPQQKHNWDWATFVGKANIDGEEKTIRAVFEGVNSLAAYAAQPQKGQVILFVDDEKYRIDDAQITFDYDLKYPQRKWQVSMQNSNGDIRLDIPQISVAHDKSVSVPVLVKTQFFSGWEPETVLQLQHPTIGNVSVMGRSYVESAQFTRRLTDDYYDSETKTFPNTWRAEYLRELQEPSVRSVSFLTEIWGYELEHFYELLDGDEFAFRDHWELLIRQKNNFLDYLDTSYAGQLISGSKILFGDLSDEIQTGFNWGKTVKKFSDSSVRTKRAYYETGFGYQLRRYARLVYDHLLIPVFSNTNLKNPLNQIKPYPEFDSISPRPNLTFTYSDPVCTTGASFFHLRDLEADIYLPDSEAPSNGHPVIHVFHGGGFLLGNKRTIHARVLAKYFTNQGYAIVSWDLPQAVRSATDVFYDSFFEKRSLMELTLTPIKHGLEKLEKINKGQKELNLNLNNTAFMGVSAGGTVAHALAAELEREKSRYAPSKLFLFSAPSDFDSFDSAIMTYLTLNFVIHDDPLNQPFTGASYVFHGTSDRLVQYPHFDRWKTTLPKVQPIEIAYAEHGSLNDWWDPKAQFQMKMALDFLIDP